MLAEVGFWHHLAQVVECVVQHVHASSFPFSGSLSGVAIRRPASLEKKGQY